MKPFRLLAGILWLLAASAAQAQTVSKLVVTPSPAFGVAGGAPLQFHAIATNTNGTIQDVTAAVTWTSDDTTAATITPAGVATALGGTVANITATLGTRTSRAIFNIEASSPSLPAAVATIPVGANPIAIAVNPITGKTYVANTGTNNVTVIDGLTYAATTVSAGAAPSGIAVNPATNRIYVANNGSNDVTVIDGQTNAVSTVAVGASPQAIAINEVTNRIYVVGTSSLTVIDGKTNNATIIPATSGLISLAVNPVTNRIYAGIQLPNPGVLVFDGATNTQLASIPLPTGPTPLFLAVNTAANQIYAATPLVGLFTIIDGQTNAVSMPFVQGGASAIAVDPVLNKVIIGSRSAAIFDPPTASSFTIFPAANLTGYTAAAVNPVTNQAYLLSSRSNTVGVLDGPHGYAMTTSISTGSAPVALAVNPVTNKVFVVNSGDNTVTVIDGAANTPGPLPTGTRSLGVAVNPLTNKIYVANSISNDVTVIDGPSGLASTIPAGLGTSLIDVDPLLNKIYAVNVRANSVTIIDGATNATVTVPVGANPRGLAVNPLTGKAYVVSSGDGSLTVIDGPTNSTSRIAIGTFTPSSAIYRIGVNQRTNKLYIPLEGAGTVLVFDAASNAFASIAVGGIPHGVAVNPVTNLVYVANQTPAITVIDGVTNLTTPVSLGLFPNDIAVNPVTNRVYVLSTGATVLLTVIDGATNRTNAVTLPLFAAVSTLAIDSVTNRIYAGSIGGNANNGVVSVDGETNASLLTGSTGTLAVRATAFAVNPATSRVYAVAPLAGASGSVISEDAAQNSNLPLAVTPLAANRTANPLQPFTLSATGAASLYYRFDSRAGAWATATQNADGAYTAVPLAPLAPGFHLLLAYSTANQTSNLTGTGAGLGNAQSPLVTALVAYPFYVTPGPVIVAVSVTQAIAASPGVGWVATFTVANTGNVAIANLQVANATLNGVPPLAPIAPAANTIEPGQSFPFTLTFPTTAAVSRSRGSLTIQGSYDALLPTGSTQPGAFSSGFRIVLP